MPVEEDVKKVARSRERASKLAFKRAAEAKLIAPEPEPKVIDLKADLWKYALLVIAQQPNMEMTTKDLIAEIPNYITVPDEASAADMSRKDSKFSQFVRNLKSHKTTKSNFIYQGYAEDIEGGFRMTMKGLKFVKEYFD